MGSFNNTVLMGNAVAEPELHYTGSGTEVANFSIAVNTKRGERERVLFLPCVVFGKLAEISVKYIQKGKNILVSGELVQEQWENDEGQKRSQIKLYINQLQLLGSPAGGNPEDKTESEEF